MTRRIAPRWLWLVTLAAVTWWLASPTTPDSFRVLFDRLHDRWTSLRYGTRSGPEVPA